MAVQITVDDNNTNNESDVFLPEACICVCRIFTVHAKYHSEEFVSIMHSAISAVSAALQLQSLLNGVM